MDKFLDGVTPMKVVLLAASLIAFAYLFGFTFAVVLLACLFIHEMGHVWAMKLYGVPVKGIYFIPFMGAVAVASKKFPSRQAEVVIALMGPFWGLGTAVVLGAGYVFTSNPDIAVMAAMIALVNLFNLVPINPLDGGRAVKSILVSIHQKSGLVFLGTMLVCIVVLYFYTSSFMFLLVLFASFGEFVNELREMYQQKDRENMLHALAEFLGCEKDISVVSEKMLSLRVMSDTRLYQCGIISSDARGVYRLPFAKGYSTSIELIDDVEKLVLFLRQTELPKMRLGGIVLGSLAYVGLIFLLLVVTSLSMMAPGAMESFQHLRR